MSCLERLEMSNLNLKTVTADAILDAFGSVRSTSGSSDAFVLPDCLSYASVSGAILIQLFERSN